MSDARKDTVGVVALQPSIWAEYLKFHKEDDEAMIESWREDMDGLLIFAGLYSATLTAFIIESYKLLKPDSGDLTTALLVQISQQIANRSTVITQSAELVPFVAARSSVAVNILWFLSLLFSLACALGATMVKQWSRDFSQRVRRQRTTEHRGRVRALLREGIDGWRLDSVVDALPTLLHVAVVLFLAGLLIFLFNVDRAVFLVMLVSLCGFGSGYAYFTVAPIGRGDCPFRTPLSASMRLAAFRLLRTLGQSSDDKVVKTSQVVILSPDLYAHEAHGAREAEEMPVGAWKRRTAIEGQVLRWALTQMPDEHHTVIRQLPDFIGSIEAPARRATVDIMLHESTQALEAKICSLPTPRERMQQVWACLVSATAVLPDSLSYSSYHRLTSLFLSHIMVDTFHDAGAKVTQHCSRILLSVITSRSRHVDFFDYVSDVPPGVSVLDVAYLVTRDLHRFPTWHVAHEYLSRTVETLKTARQSLGMAPDFRPTAHMIGDIEKAGDLISRERCRWYMFEVHFDFLFSGAVDIQHLWQFAQTAHYLVRLNGEIFYAKMISGGEIMEHIDQRVVKIFQGIMRKAMEMNDAHFDRLEMHSLFVPADPEMLTSPQYLESPHQLPCVLNRQTCTDDLFEDLFLFSRQYPDRKFATDAVDRSTALWDMKHKQHQLEAALERKDPSISSTQRHGSIIGGADGAETTSARTAGADSGKDNPCSVSTDPDSRAMSSAREASGHVSLTVSTAMDSPVLGKPLRNASGADAEPSYVRGSAKPLHGDTGSEGG